jgi:hypothetical protein
VSVGKISELSVEARNKTGVRDTSEIGWNTQETSTERKQRRERAEDWKIDRYANDWQPTTNPQLVGILIYQLTVDSPLL